MVKAPIFTRLSPSTGDYTALVKAYLISVGHRGRGPIGKLQVWTRREGGKVVAVGPTRASIDPDHKHGPIEINPEEWTGAA